MLTGMNDLGALRSSYGEQPFRRRDAIVEGFSTRTLDGEAVHRPFRGVRSLAPPSDVHAQIRAYHTKLTEDRAFTGATAAIIRGWPVPARLRRATELDIAGPHRSGRAREAGIRSTRVTERLWHTSTIDGLPVASAELTLLDLARRCRPNELVQLGDAAIATSRWYPGIVERPATTPDALRAFLDECGRMHGVPRLRQALERIRLGVESPMETLTRLVIVDAGLDEPEVGGEIWEGGERLGRGDLVFRQARVVVEYEGRYHSERAAFEGDITRIRRMERAGWRVIRLTHADLFPSHERFVAELRQVLTARAR